MKKVFIAAALAAMIVSCGSKGNKSAEIIAESESDSIFAVNDSTLGELQTYSYEGILPAADAEGINYQLTFAVDLSSIYSLIDTHSSGLFAKIPETIMNTVPSCKIIISTRSKGCSASR